MSESSTPSAVDVLTQLVTGPSLTEVASKALRPALKKMYPRLEIDPQLAMVVTPNWLLEADQVIPDFPSGRIAHRYPGAPRIVRYDRDLHRRRTLSDLSTRH